ncbi:MAG: hypothetical protein HZA81_02605 [Candidatus Taylorbacteria bacterium]|nr:hypothetical protein [Candidatus Taylorbacteria bacterium]
MTGASYIGIAAGILSLGGYIPYALKIVRGGIKPERASSLIWLLSNVLILMSYYALGARDTIWLPLAYVIGSAAVTALSFRYGTEGWGALEKFALGIAFIGAIRWIFFDNVLFTLLANLAIGLTTYLSPIKDLIQNPEQEKYKLVAWTVFFVGASLNLLAVPSWTLAISTMPIAVFVVNALVFGLVAINMLRAKKGPPQAPAVQ